MKLLRVVRFVGFYLYELVRANLLIAKEVITPRSGTRPAVVEVPLRGRRPMQVVLLANLVSLTPGTLTLDVSEARDVMYVHGLHVSDPDDLRARIAALETRMLEALW